MLTDILREAQQRDMERLHQDEMDFLYVTACKYNMTCEEVRRFCLFMHLDYLSFKNHTLENRDVH